LEIPIDKIKIPDNEKMRKMVASGKMKNAKDYLEEEFRKHTKNLLELQLKVNKEKMRIFQIKIDLDEVNDKILYAGNPPKELDDKGIQEFIEGMDILVKEKMMIEEKLKKLN
jgi:hypothetical protein